MQVFEDKVFAIKFKTSAFKTTFWRQVNSK